MTNREKVILLAAAVIFLTTVWMARFDIVTPAASPRGVYKIDRWTGRVDHIIGMRSREGTRSTARFRVAIETEFLLSRMAGLVGMNLLA